MLGEEGSEAGEGSILPGFGGSATRCYSLIISAAPLMLQVLLASKSLVHKIECFDQTASSQKSQIDEFLVALPLRDDFSSNLQST